jgi:uncharacterized protein YkwD
MKKVALVGVMMALTAVTAIYIATSRQTKPTPLSIKQEIIQRVQASVAPLPTIVPFEADEHKIWLLIQDWRQANGKRQYNENAVLCKYAYQRLEEVKTDWSHDGFWRVSKSAKAESGFTNVGENLAHFMFSNQDYLDNWLASPEHKKNLDNNFTESCLRCSTDYCVQLFGKY